MTNIVFEPWIGTAFRASSPRLLLLGESHYGEPYHIPALATHYVVEQWRSSQWSVRYLLAAARMLTGLKAWDVDKSNALERIAFYNYVQIMMPNLKNRPTFHQIQQSEAAFREVLEKLDPTHIIATGYTLWRGMPHFDIEGISGSFNQLGNENIEVGRYRTPSGFALVTVIPHLSRYFSPQRWHGPISEFLNMKP